jgi:hypothetical protein
MTATITNVTLGTVLTPSDDVMFQEIGGEAVLLDLASEQYFGLDVVGTRIWSLLDPGTPLHDIHEKLCQEYDAEPAMIAADLLTLAGRLLEAGLVRLAPP